MRHVALVAFRVFPRFLPSPSAPATADALAARLESDCRVAFTARAARADKQYSSGETFWLAADAEPRCALEHLARRVFDLHVPAAAREARGEPARGEPADAAPPYDPARSGAEWWTQVIDPREAPSPQRAAVPRARRGDRLDAVGALAAPLSAGGTHL